ncbi:MAG: bifunctional oligoribonuclease/PAP phosphatase NrnA [Lachnospiraceae bacterium]|nr:bifunctional oligoribonuclease/PAP phosphatase NrnA [Lachnospiraceae bacterium]
MNKLADWLQGVKTLAIAGHVNPDGDCIGSCMGMYLYVKKYFKEIQVDVYLEKPKPEFYFIQSMDEIKHEAEGEKVYDLFISLDTSTADRIGVADMYYNTAKRTVCIDHHVSNNGYAGENHIESETSSCAEVLFGLVEEEKVTKEIAEAIYTGIIHDTGVFQYASTSAQTLNIAGKLINTGINFTKIIDDSFNKKTYLQNQIMGRTLLESMLFLDGACIVGFVTRKEMDFYGVTKQDLDGIVAQMRQTEGVEVAIFIYETGVQEFKVSLRSNGKVDVNAVAVAFAGGGHVRAAGCTMHGSARDVVNNLLDHIAPQIKDEA